MTKRDLGSTIDAIYAAVLEPEKWENTLSKVAEAVGAFGANMCPIGPEAATWSLTTSNLAEANQDYQKFWWQHDKAATRVLSLGIKSGSVGTDRDIMDESEIRNDPFHQDFLRKHGILQPLTALASLGQGRVLMISAQRGIKKGLFSKANIQSMRTLAPHLGRAISLTTNMIEAQKETNDLSAAIERLGLGVILLDNRGDVRHVNAVAETILGDGLSIGNRRLSAASRHDEDRLQTAIRSALPDSGLLPATGILIHQPRRKTPLYVEITPVRPRLDALEIMTFGAGGVMLLIRPLDGAAHSLAHHLQTFGLSPAEIRLAETVGHGNTLRMAAEIHAISYETARVQLRSIFAKLGFHRQAELVAFIIRLSTAISA